jgi:hypothetical protein
MIMVLNTPPTKRRISQLLFCCIQELGYGETATWVGFPAAGGDGHDGIAEGEELLVASAPRGDRTSVNRGKYCSEIRQRADRRQSPGRVLSEKAYA